jgi:hypothetical protein
MAAVTPVVKGVYVCDEVLADPGSRKVSLLNAFTTLRPGTPGFPYELGRMCVLVALRGGRGPARFRVDVVPSGGEGVVYRTVDRELRFVDPLMTVSASFRLERVRFPRPGRYGVEVVCDNEFLDDQIITVLATAEG